MRMIEGLSKGYQGSLVPIISTNLTLYDAVTRLAHLTGAVLPTSARKIQHCKVGGCTCNHSCLPARAAPMPVCVCALPGVYTRVCICLLEGLCALQAVGLGVNITGCMCAHQAKVTRPFPCTDNSLLPVCHALLIPVFPFQSLFDQNVDANMLVAGIEKEEELITSSKRVTPKMFAHSIKTKCLANPQHVVLPEVGAV